MSLDMTKIITEDDKIELDFPTVRNQHQFPQSEEQRIKLFDQYGQSSFYICENN